MELHVAMAIKPCFIFFRIRSTSDWIINLLNSALLFKPTVFHFSSHSNCRFYISHPFNLPKWF
jgi:hypothetical protein